MIRTGLFLYDILGHRNWLGGRSTLPRSRRVTLDHARPNPPHPDRARAPAHSKDVAHYGAGLKEGFDTGFAYYDCWVDDARLVIANARAAVELGATVLTRTACTAATRDGERWRVTLQPESANPTIVTCHALANVTGPWAKQFINQNIHLPTIFGLRLVKGSHIVVPRLFGGEHAFILQNDDRRVVFVYPYEGRTLIGTTDVEYTGDPAGGVPSVVEG